MIYRCYNEEFHQTKKGECYIGCSVCERWLTLSNFVADFENIDGYDRERFINGELVLDKDIKSGGTNKTYIIEQCKLVTNEETKRKMSENSGMKGKRKFAGGFIWKYVEEEF